MDRMERTMLYSVSFYVGIDALSRITDRLAAWFG